MTADATPPDASESVEWTRSEAEAAHCWFAADHVAGDPATTAWKRRARLGQARWREALGYPPGAEPYDGRPGATRVGSRLDLAFARRTGANFLSPGALEAVRSRLRWKERYQMLREDRLWADLLSSMPLCFNLFGDLAEDSAAAANALHRWWPDAPRGLVQTCFEHSPGRRDPSYLGNQSAFDVAFEIAITDAERAIIGVETKYHEHAVVEPRPESTRLRRYVEVTESSGIFDLDWFGQIVGTDLQQIWLDHLLVLAMLQHPSRRWRWGKFVLVYPGQNPSFASASARYRALLRDDSTFEAKTLEQLLLECGAQKNAWAAAIQDRYLPR